MHYSKYNTKTVENLLPILMFVPVFRSRGLYTPIFFGDFEFRYIFLIHICIRKKSVEKPPLNQWFCAENTRFSSFSIDFESNDIQLTYIRVRKNVQKISTGSNSLKRKNAIDVVFHASVRISFAQMFWLHFGAHNTLLSGYFLMTIIRILATFIAGNIG